MGGSTPRMGILLRLLVLGPGFAAASEVEEQAIARCAAIADVDGRIACLEDALRETSKDPRTAPVITNEPAGPAKAAARNTAADHEFDPPGTGPVEPQGSIQERATGAEEFGLPANRRDQGSRESVVVDVVAVGQTAHGKLVFRTASGQIWQQIDMRTPRYPEIPFKAEIRAAVAGSYFMRPVSGGVSVRVRRDR